MLRKRAKLVGLLSALLLVLFVCPLSAQATVPGQNGKIAYVDGGNIWVMNADGTAKTQLTLEQLDGAPDWSPDGSKIVFARNVAGPGNGIYVMNADGSGQQPILSPVVHWPEPSWSPDGTRIAFIGGAAPAIPPFVGGGGQARIWTVDADGSDPADLPTNGRDPEEERLPHWSPDGTEIAFSWCPNGECELPSSYGIAAVPANGGTYRPIAFGSPLDWSPDSGHLLQSVFGDEMNRIRRDGTDTQFIAFGPQYASWSPDGSKIVVDDPLDTNQVIVLDADGGNALPLGPGADPDWQSLTAPRPGDFKNRAQFCKAETTFYGEAGFRARYGGGANAHGKCVSSK